jgi:hypothetical protein
MTQRSLLDEPQIVQEVYDATNKALQVSIVSSTPTGSAQPILDGVGGVLLAQVTAAHALKVDPSAVISPISAAQLPATLGSKTTANSTAVTIASDQIVPVSASSLPLPSGASTEATLLAFSSKSASALVVVPFDNIAFTYVPSGNGVGQIQTAVYKLSSTTVATLTMTYDSNNSLSTVVKS